MQNPRSPGIFDNERQIQNCLCISFSEFFFRFAEIDRYRLVCRGHHSFAREPGRLSMPCFQHRLARVKLVNQSVLQKRFYVINSPCFRLSRQSGTRGGIKFTIYCSIGSFSDFKADDFNPTTDKQLNDSTNKQFPVHCYLIAWIRPN